MKGRYLIGLILVILMLPGAVYRHHRHQEARKKARLHALFQLPPEAVILSGREREWLGIAADIEFRLPRTRSPEEWLKLLAERPGSEVTRQRNNRLLYDCGQDCGHGMARIEYVPARDIYMASYYED